MSEGWRRFAELREDFVPANRVSARGAGNFEISGPFSSKKTMPLAMGLRDGSGAGPGGSVGIEFIGKVKREAVCPVPGGCA